MNVSLTPELEQLVTGKVESGMYQTASEVVREGLRLLRERDLQMEALRRDVAKGFQAISEGRFNDYAPKEIARLAGTVKERGRKRLAASR